MSSHSLLVMHNLSILESFFSSIRSVLLNQDREGWEREVERFMEMYDDRLEVFDEARDMWREVDLARGKGRLAREKAKSQEQSEEAFEGAVGP
jgi:queuine tRNA-ribosyltransferase